MPREEDGSKEEWWMGNAKCDEPTVDLKVRK